MRRQILTIAPFLLAPMLLAPMLQAQGAHYERGVLITTTTQDEMIRLPRHPEPIPSLTFSNPDGRTRTLALPPELDGRLGRCIQITHYQGISYAVGFMHLPLPPGRAGREAMKQAYFEQPRRLYACGPDGKWTLLARLESDTSYRAWKLIPLGNEKFLYGNPTLCWQGDAVSPFGIYRVENGRLQLERLVDLGLGGPWYQAVPFPAGSDYAKRFGRGPQITETYRQVQGHSDAWQVLRVPSGLCFLHKTSRRWFLLDDQAFRCLHQGQLPGTDPEEILAAAVRPDGQVLVATRPGSTSERIKAWMDTSDIYNTLQYSSKPGENLLKGRADAIRPSAFQEVPVTAQWRILDPITQQAWDTPPPRNLIIQIFPFGLAPGELQVLPSGNLRLILDPWTSRHRPKRLRYDWLDRLLKPFTHDWRKLEP